MENLAARNKKFGNPDKFLSHIDKTKWMSFFLTVEDYPEFFERLEKMTGSKSGTGGGITFMDSGWEMSLVIYDRDYFPDQREKNRDVLWGDACLESVLAAISKSLWRSAQEMRSLKRCCTILECWI